MGTDDEQLHLDRPPAEVLARRAAKVPPELISVRPMQLVPPGKPPNWCGGTPPTDDEPPSAA